MKLLVLVGLPIRAVIAAVLVTFLVALSIFGLCLSVIIEAKTSFAFKRECIDAIDWVVNP